MWVGSRKGDFEGVGSPQKKGKKRGLGKDLKVVGKGSRGGWGRVETGGGGGSVEEESSRYSKACFLSIVLPVIPSRCMLIVCVAWRVGGRTHVICWSIFCFPFRF